MITVLTTIALSVWGVCASSQPAFASPSTVTINHVIYSYDSSQPELGATITGEDGSLGDTLNPPETITVSGQEYSVVAIGDLAFDDNVSLRHVVLPPSLRNIGVRAFSQTSSGGGITDIHLNDGLLTIGASAFIRTSLISLEIPDSVTAIGDCVACSIPSLTELYISHSLTAIPDAAFMYNTALRYVEIPASVTTIGNSAFYWSPLEDLFIPGNVVSIGSMAFSMSQGPVVFDGAPPSINSQYPPFSNGVEVNFTCPYASAIVAGQWQGYPATAYCAVTFHAYPGTSVPFEQTTYGGYVSPPPTPTYAGHDFAGWFTDNTLTTPFDFSVALYSDQHAYAKWVPASAPTLAQTSGPNAGFGGVVTLLMLSSGSVLMWLSRRSTLRQ